MEKDLRGGCSGMPLQLCGEFTGYNTGATMQVGLWIANDGERIDDARKAATDGPAALARHLTEVMVHSHDGEAPFLTLNAVMDSEGGLSRVDWGQICFDLVFIEPDEEDLAEARNALVARMGYEDAPGENETWEFAYELNREAAEKVALKGVSR